MRRVMPWVLLSLSLAACEKPRDAQPALLEPVQHPRGEHMPLPDPEEQGGRVGRSPRRITVAQLGRSIEVTVGRPWTQLNGLAASLGQADYALVNSENVEPNLVFAKFLEDGAREVCLTQVVEELKQPPTVQLTLTPTLPRPVGDLRKLTRPQVDEFLISLSTRFWGAPLQGEELEKWVAFFTQAANRVESLSTRPRSHALAAVCIAMMTDPRFLTY
jgi:hypothetical protein